MNDPGQPEGLPLSAWQVRFLRSVTTRHKPAPLMLVMLARFPGRLLPAHPATFKVGWPPGPFIRYILPPSLVLFYVNF